MEEKLHDKLETKGIKQTGNKTVEGSAVASPSPGSRSKIQQIDFKDSAILGIKKTLINCELTFCLSF